MPARECENAFLGHFLQHSFAILSRAHIDFQRFAREVNLEVSVRSGGHSYTCTSIKVSIFDLFNPFKQNIEVRAVLQEGRNTRSSINISVDLPD